MSIFCNLFLFFLNQEEESGIHLLYSTPSCYVYNLNTANKTWTTKKEDFMPYGDAPHNFWSGYFVSRPSIKGYVRESNNILQVLRMENIICMKGFEPTSKISESYAFFAKVPGWPCNCKNVSHGLWKNTRMIVQYFYISPGRDAQKTITKRGKHFFKKFCYFSKLVSVSDHSSTQVCKQLECLKTTKASSERLSKYIEENKHNKDVYFLLKIWLNDYIAELSRNIVVQ